MEFHNLDDLRVLLAIAETGGLTAAGKRCGLSTAAVSAALKRLEKSIGVLLFERTTRSVRPTTEGEVMIDHARRALELVSEGQALVRVGTHGLTGTIRITVAAALAREMLAWWLAEFAKSNPGISIDLQVSDAQLDLVREGIDMALRNGPLADSSHTARLLAPAQRVACASPAYLAERGTPVSPCELAQHECLVYHVRGHRLDTWHFKADGAPMDVRVRGRLSCNDASIAQQWAVEGRGIVYQAELGLTAALACGALVRLFPGYQGEPAPLYVVLPSRRYVPARVTEVIDRLAALFEEKLAAVRTGA
ncbi:MAG: LysR family transcriptional regulator [Pseudomonadota bacterium]|uniref:LysR family transcriptional regulator n=1 Tax=Polaromonas sp. TaxID=1869339 RepID=UPI0017FC1375|nr:LysR family transcriptional regulator [Polaromonas sp.]MBA3592959.1 LysR family transcriptional regulator [Polaromonas sp.]MDQ3271378.1 LysR family transcriptional regulator [Pseudomonadota bacterium]